MEVFKALFHLILGSAKLAVNWMGTTFLAVVVFAVPFIFRLAVGFKRNKWHGVAKALGPASLYTAAAWTMLFCIGMGRFVYRDHKSLVLASSVLRNKNNERQPGDASNLSTCENNLKVSSENCERQAKSQQSVIDNLLASSNANPPLKTTLLNGGPLPTDTKIGANAQLFIVLTNKTISPIHGVFICDHDLVDVRPWVAGAGGIGFSGNGKMAPNMFGVDIEFPAMGPDSPLLLTAYFNEANVGACRFGPR